MSGKAFRPTIARMQNSMKVLNSTKTNATIRDLEEEEGELEEKEGVVVSIKRDLINGAGWTVKDSEGNTYICSCASSMYEVPETVERGGILYPTDTVEVVFTVNPVLRINTIKEIKSLGEETEKIDISQWTHGDEATTVIAKPKSALSISDGFIKLDYNNDNKVLADKDAVKTQGQETSIETQKLTINSPEVQIQGTSINDLIDNAALSISNEYEVYNVDTLNDLSIYLDRTNNMTQLSINTLDKKNLNGYGVIGHIKDQKAIPIRMQSQQLITDGNCVDNIVIDANGVIYIKSFENECPSERQVSSTHNWITPQVQSRNYIKVIIKQTCNYCDDMSNTKAEYINYCPSCNNWNTLTSTPTLIRCTTCNSQYCQNCGTKIDDITKVLKKYNDYHISIHGLTCSHCKDQLSPNTVKQYVNYCPDCQTWGFLYQDEKQENNNMINILTCGNCRKEYCGTCGISQTSYGLTLEENPVSYELYNDALRKLKYIRDGA